MRCVGPVGDGGVLGIEPDRRDLEGTQLEEIEKGDANNSSMTDDHNGCSCVLVNDPMECRCYPVDKLD